MNWNAGMRVSKASKLSGPAYFNSHWNSIVTATQAPFSTQNYNEAVTGPVFSCIREDIVNSDDLTS